MDTYGLECLTLNEVLSPKMNFNIITLYNPPKHNVIFCQIFDDLLKVLNHRSETILLRDFNKTGWTKTESKHLKQLYPSINCTRKSKSQPEASKTLIDLIFTNTRDRLSKIHILLTGLSDHNMILIIRKLTNVYNIYRDSYSNRIIIMCQQEFLNERKNKSI